MAVKSVKKAMDLLDLVVDSSLHNRPSSLAELSAGLDMPNNSAHSILKTLVNCGYVEQVGHGLYGPGQKVRELGMLNYLESSAAQSRIAAVLSGFVDRTDEACVLTVLAHGERMVVSHVDCTRAIRVSEAGFDDVSLFSVPTGRVLAALAGQEQLKEVIDRYGMPGKTWNGINTETELRTALEDIRDRGCCSIVNEEEEIFSCACEVPGSLGEMPAAVGAFAPLFRCADKRQKELMEEVRSSAEELAGVICGS